MSALPLASSQLSFTRDGRRLLAIDADAVAIVETRSAVTCRLPIDATIAAAGFVDQIWIAHGREPVLSRFTLEGAPIGRPLALPVGGTLIAAAVGTPAAVWAASPAVVLLEEHGAVQVAPGPATGELALPLTGRRWVTASGARVIAPSGLICELAAGSRVIGGAIVLEGTAAVIVAERSGGRDLVVVGLSNARPQLRLPVPSAVLRVAARRGVVAVQLEPRRIGIIDLRSGRVLGEVTPPFDVTDFTLDPDGQRIALRGTAPTVELVALRDAFAAAVAAAAVVSDDLDPHRTKPAGAEPANVEVSGEASASGGPVCVEVAGEPGGVVPAAVASPSQVIEPSGDLPAPAASPSEVFEASGDVPGPAASPPRVTDPGAAAAAMEACAPWVAAAGAIVRPLELRALAPRAQVLPIERDVALARLDQETRTVALWTLRAIAEAWDSRRIGYGNEGRHPYEHEVAALLGMNRGFAGEHVAAAREHLAEHEAALEGIADRRAPATPLGALATELGLSALAIDILLVIAAPALWSEAARLYGILANDPGRALVDEALVEQVLGRRISRHELAAELDPRAPLVRLGVIEVDRRRARPFAALEVDPIVLARLRREAPDLGAGVSARGSDRALEELALGPDVVAEALVALARAPGHARIALRGRPGSGRRTLLAALAAEAGRALGIVETALLPRADRELAGALRAGLRRAQLAGLLPCVVGLEDIAFGELAGREAVTEILRAHPGPLAVVLPTGAAAPLDPGHVAIDLPVLAEGDRLAVWRGALGDAGLAVADPSVLAARYRLGPGAIHRAIAATVERTRDHTLDDVTGELERFIRQTRDTRLGAHARRVDRLGTWDGLVLPTDVLDSLRELVARVRHRRTVFETWGMDRTMATSRGLTAMFSGPPGTGKTLVAGVIARELGLDLYQVDLSKMMSKWIGETERNLAAIFDAAEDGQVILLFDEADSLFAKRTEVRSSNDRYANLEVNYLLQRLDSFEGIAILTTNASGSIDPAFKRRLSFRLSFPFPDEDTREQLWRAHLPPTLPQTGELGLDRLAHKYQLSGGYIRNACLRAAFLAAQDESSLTQHHLERAVALEFAELGKLSNSGSID